MIDAATADRIRASENELPLETQQAFRRWLLILGCWYALFVIYGSLVPLDFTARPMDEALARFRAIPYLDLGIASRADWVANILLYIPLALLWFGAFATGVSSLARRAGIALAVFAGGFALGVGIEFVQIFFPPRTVSLNDVLAQGIGSFIGVAAWIQLRHGLLRAWQLWHGQARAERTLTNAVAIYLAAVLGYGVLPLDLTISIAELHDKWSAGRLLLNPFRLDGGGWAMNVYALGVDVLLWMPLTAYLVRARRVDTVRAVALTVAMALLLELAQTVVYSRVADSRDVLLAFVGAALAARFTGAGLVGGAAHSFALAQQRLALALLAFAAWSVIVLAIFWYPYGFTDDVKQIAPRLREVSLVPFKAYYFGTEYRAATEMLRKLLLFAPYGVLAAAAGLRPAWTIAGTLAIATTVEAGQLLLPGKVVDPGDVLFAIAGAVIAHRATAAFSNRPGHAPRDTTVPPATRPDDGLLLRLLPGVAHTWRPVLLTAGAFLLLSMLAATGLAHVEALPYNLREALGTRSPALAGLGLGLCAWLAIAATSVLGAWLGSNTPAPKVLLLPGALVAIGILEWGVLAASVPREAIHDLVGSPVLDWPWRFETMLRLATLGGFGLLAATAGCAVVVDHLLGGRLPGRATRRALLAFALLLPLFHHVIVTRAATDNLIELMEGGGSLLTIALLGAWIGLLSVTAFAIATQERRSVQGVFMAVAVVLISAPVGYLLVSVALEDQLIKYGSAFSALQFLLSPDRDTLVDGTALLARYSIAHGVIIVSIALIGAPILRALLSPGVAEATAQAGPSRRTDASGAPAYYPLGGDRGAPANASSSPPAAHDRAPGGRESTLVVRLAPPQYQQLKDLAATLDCSLSEAMARLLDHMMDRKRGEHWFDGERGHLRQPQNRAGLRGHRLTLAKDYHLYLEALRDGSGVSSSRILRAAIEEFAPAVARDSSA